MWEWTNGPLVGEKRGRETDLRSIVLGLGWLLMVHPRVNDLLVGVKRGRGKQIWASRMTQDDPRSWCFKGVETNKVVVLATIFIYVRYRV